MPPGEKSQLLVRAFTFDNFGFEFLVRDLQRVVVEFLPSSTISLYPREHLVWSKGFAKNSSAPASIPRIPSCLAVNAGNHNDRVCS